MSTMAPSGGGTAFATVGTTCFDALVRALDSAEAVAALRARGLGALVLQVGRGAYLPRQLVPAGGADEGAAELADGFRVAYYRFKPNLGADIAGADIVISHAGAGTVMECLRARKRMVVVVNEQLMDNHQMELAGALDRMGTLRCTTCTGLLQVLRDDPLRFTAYPEPNVSAFARMLDAEVFGSD
jgi:beta-1,4-N-acetylglucosaminyltransferase